MLPPALRNALYRLAVKFITENLRAIVETGKASLGGRIALIMMGMFAPFTPKRCRSENWPF